MGNAPADASLDPLHPLIVSRRRIAEFVWLAAENRLIGKCSAPIAREPVSGNATLLANLCPIYCGGARVTQDHARPFCMSAYSSDLEYFVERSTPTNDWPVYIHLSSTISPTAEKLIK
jgi:hypothetical protein